MKPFRQFGALERKSVDDFDLVQLSEDFEEPWGSYPKGTWTLQLGGKIYFTLDTDLVHASEDFTEYEVAAMLFDWMFNKSSDTASIAYDYGRKTVQDEMKATLGIS